MDDRHHERVDLSFEVEYRTAGAFLVAYSSNLSKGGIFLDTKQPPPIGTELILKFNIPGTESIEVKGVVVWIRPTGSEGKPAGMGVEFENLDARHGELIDVMVSRFQGLHVLVLAASPHSRALLGRGVKSILSSAEVVEVVDADAAEKAIAKHADLVIVDLDDSDADGLLTMRLAKTSVRRPLPVIAASRHERKRGRARELGADEILNAPIAMHELQAAILRALGKPLRVG